MDVRGMPYCGRAKAAVWYSTMRAHQPISIVGHLYNGAAIYIRQTHYTAWALACNCAQLLYLCLEVQYSPVYGLSWPLIDVLVLWYVHPPLTFSKRRHACNLMHC